tara:strand:+ start:55 stop:480 length:426 start_codon:yes stop_codon:yes gene_type:complete
MPFATLLAAALSFSRTFPTDLGSPSNRLVHAARLGDLQVVRRCLLDHKVASLDLDSALDAAAAYAHLSVVELLVAFGATDLDSALLSAAARDHVKVVAYLISEKRLNPATNTKDAQTLAANVGAINCDWLLTAHRWDELRS